MQYAEILFDQKVGSQETLTYAIPEDLHIEIGDLVEVSMRNRKKNGIVFDIHSNKPSFRTLEISKKHHDRSLISQNQVKILKWMSQYYFCPTHKLIKNFIPKRVMQNKPFRVKKEKQIEQIINTKELKLTKEQIAVLDGIKNSSKNKFLVHGVTGSGKTEIYSRLARQSIVKNEQVLILVPEISLTTQNISYFEKSTGVKATVIHSQLSEGQRYQSWMDIWNNKSKLVIGSRSAIFGPFQALGLIIIDEEHENSYKQDSSPRYKTHQIAEKMQSLEPQLKVVLGSATPSIESAEILSETTLEMQTRVSNNPMPQISIVDLRDEFKKHNHSIFSEELQAALTETLEKKQQTILFLNRRGSASSVVCRDCGYTADCSSCETTMTYHAQTLGQEAMICHHCGEISNPPKVCPKCQSVNIRFLGIGTQRIEKDLKEQFPEARVLRADKDTTSRKDAFKNIYQSFKKHEADILIGTQMIAKGLHLPKVSLVGVILADIGLNIPDFRANERNFQLMTQVAGRAGRGDSPGKVIIQTYNPENLALKFAQENNYQDFFKYERTQRKLLNNPPFSQLVKFLVEEKSENAARKKSEEIENKIWQIARENNLAENIDINAYPAYFLRLRGKYRYIVLLKDKNKEVHKLLEKLPKEYIMAANIKIDVDPISIT